MIFFFIFSPFLSLLLRLHGSHWEKKAKAIENSEDYEGHKFRTSISNSCSQEVGAEHERSYRAESVILPINLFRGLCLYHLALDIIRFSPVDSGPLWLDVMQHWINLVSFLNKEGLSDCWKENNSHYCFLVVFLQYSLQGIGLPI